MMKFRFALLAVVLALIAVPDRAQQSTNELAQQIYDLMAKNHGFQAGNRAAHAKGIVVHGTFKGTAAADELTSAAHFQGKRVPVTVRFSDGSVDPTIPDNSNDAYPSGFAIRFEVPGGDKTDIVAISHNGFIIGTGAEMLALEQSIVATDPSKPHPWPVEQFIGSHPRALKFVQDTKRPASFATQPYYSNNAFVFVNKGGKHQAFRYQIRPMAAVKYLDDAEVKTKGPNYLADELRARLATGPVTFRLMAQLPNPGDPTNDGSIVWGDDRTIIEIGLITLTAVAKDSDAESKQLAFDPILLTDGIELSDDPLPELRSLVYGLSAMQR